MRFASPMLLLAVLHFHPLSADVWVATNGPVFVPGFGVQALGFNADDELFAPITDGSCFSSDALGVFRSSDRGDSWTQINQGLATTNVRSLTVTPSGIVFAGTRNGVFVSADNGDSWTVTALAGTDLSVLESDEKSVYAGDGCFCTGIHRSRNGGATWRRLNNGLQTCINALAIDTTGTLYAGSGVSGVYRSVDDGNSWAPARTGMGSIPIRSLAINSQHHVFAGTHLQGLFRSTDGANTWSHLGVVGSDTVVWRIAIGPSDEIYIGTHPHGVFVSRDNGNTWAEENNGLPPNPSIQALAFDNEGNLFAAVRGLVYRLLHTPATRNIAIDIKPDDSTNAINPRNRGVIPVAILTTSTVQGDEADFDAATVDPSTVSFGPGLVVPAHGSGHLVDVDGDGDNDLLLHFETAEVGIRCGDTSAILTGQSLHGESLEGADTLVTVGCAGSGPGS